MPAHPTFRYTAALVAACLVCGVAVSAALLNGDSTAFSSESSAPAKLELSGDIRPLISELVSGESEVSDRSAVVQYEQAASGPARSTPRIVALSGAEAMGSSIGEPAHEIGQI